jgi:adenosyl cobinamide kinase/adenosyl cobinamide phosphate guanylyltransferase
MALKGKAPDAAKKRLKMLLFGESGSGKSTCCCSFKNVYFVDTERGAENDSYVQLLKQSQGAYFFTTDFEELLAEAMALLSEDHQYRTLVIDPLTVIYNDLLDKSAKALATKDDPSGTSFGRHKAAADRKIKHLINLLLRLDMNVVITSHAKVMWGDGMTKLGNTFDTFAKLDYICDLVVEVQKRGRDNRVGVVKKTRISGFPEGEVFPFSYDEIARRYGQDVLEAKARTEKLATDAQVKELLHLVQLLKVADDVTDRWLSKAGAESFHELPAEAAAKCIAWCHGQIKKAG